MFEEWVTDSPFIISPRITFEVSVKLLGGLMALGYTIATILKRNSHVFTDDKVTVKIDWLEQLNRHYVQVQGKDRSSVQHVAEQLGLEGSYIPRAYIEQIQLEKLVNEVMALPEDLKTKLSLDEDVVFSPRELLARASADRVAWRNENLNSGMSRSYTNHRDKSYPRLTGFNVSSNHSHKYDNGTPEPAGTMPDQGVVSRLSEQISTLNDMMDEFTLRMEELSSKLIVKKLSLSQHNLIMQPETCNGSAPRSHFLNGLSNGTLMGNIMHNSSSSPQLSKEIPLLEEMQNIARAQRQIMHQLDNLSRLLRENLVEKPRKASRGSKNWILEEIEPAKYHLVFMVALGAVGVILCRNFWTRK